MRLLWLRQNYAMSTETDDRDAVPSKVLIHYLKEDAMVSPEAGQPVTHVARQSTRRHDQVRAGSLRAESAMLSSRFPDH